MVMMDTGKDVEPDVWDGVFEEKPEVIDDAEKEDA